MFLLQHGFPTLIKLGSIKLIWELTHKPDVFSTLYAAARDLMGEDELLGDVILVSWNQCIKDISIEDNGDDAEAAAPTVIGTKSIIVHIHQLRAKLEDVPSNPMLLLTQYDSELKEYQYGMADSQVL
jgi:hypothetical protein